MEWNRQLFIILYFAGTMAVFLGLIIYYVVKQKKAQNGGGL